MPSFSTLRLWLLDNACRIERAIASEIGDKKIAIELDLWSRQAGAIAFYGSVAHYWCGGVLVSRCLGVIAMPARHTGIAIKEATIESLKR